MAHVEELLKYKIQKSLKEKWNSKSRFVRLNSQSSSSSESGKTAPPTIKHSVSVQPSATDMPLVGELKNIGNKN